MPMVSSAQSVVNGYTSQIRNMFLTSSIGIAALTFSENFKKLKLFMEIVAYCVFIYSIVYGLKASNDFTRYLNHMEKDQKLQKADIIQIDSWKRWNILTYTYCGIIAVILLIMIRRHF
jgi:hypothetical protein